MTDTKSSLQTVQPFDDALGKAIIIVAGNDLKLRSEFRRCIGDHPRSGTPAQKIKIVVVITDGKNLV